MDLNQITTIIFDVDGVFTDGSLYLSDDGIATTKFHVHDGMGCILLKEAGIEVEVGLLSEQGLELNRRFFTSFEKKRPYVILKWAQTADGFEARENYDSKWISNQYSRQMVHKWRSEEAAILVGKNTARYDNPSLTTRDWCGADPVRIVLDKKLELNRSMHLFDGSVKTYCFTTLEEVDSSNLEFIQVAEITPGVVLKELHNRRIQSIIINLLVKNLMQKYVLLLEMIRMFGQDLNLKTWRSLIC